MNLFAINRRWITLLLCLAGSHFTCSKTQKPTTPMTDQTLTDQTLTAQTTEATLTAHFVFESETTLRLTYRVQNKTSATLYFFNKLYTGFQGKTIVTDKNSVYVYLDKKKVVVAKDIAPVPAGVYAAVRVYPCATKIPPQGEFTEVVELTLPLTVQSPYMGTPGISKRVVSRPLFFSLGYFVGNAFTAAQERIAETTEGPAVRFDAFTDSSQSWITVGPLSSPTMVFETK